MHYVETERDRDAEDLAAVSAVLRGEAGAFRLLIDKYGGMVLRLSRNFLGSGEDAEDASQEIFLRAFRSLRTFRIERRFLPWLCGIAMNHLRTRYRREKRFKEKADRAKAEPVDGNVLEDPVILAERADARRAVREAVSGLPANLREAVLLYYFEGLGVQEIAEALGIGTENVKSRLFRARGKLRSMLERRATGEEAKRYTVGSAEHV